MPVCVCVCVSTFSEPTKYSDEKITEKSKFLCVALLLLKMGSKLMTAKVYYSIFSDKLISKRLSYIKVYSK